MGRVRGCKRKGRGRQRERERVREARRQERRPPSFFLYLLPAW